MRSRYLNSNTVDYLIMYEVVVYISHTVWTLESSHDGMQGNIQFTDKCIMYWLNGQNIHHEIVFSQADTWLGVYPSWTQVTLHQQYCIVEKNSESPPASTSDLGMAIVPKRQP